MSLGIGRELPPQAPQLWLHPLEGGDSGPLSSLERRWAEGLPQRRRQRYEQSRAALRQRLAWVLGCDPAAVPLHSPPGQPPRLADGWGWISLSHGTGSVGTAPGGDALLLGYSRQPIGVDLEPAGRRLEAASLLRRFYPREEQDQLEGLVGEALREAVLISWVLKEAAIKWRQRTLAEDLSQWCYDHGSGGLRHLGDGLQPDGCTAEDGGWRWAAVGPGCRNLHLNHHGLAS